MIILNSDSEFDPSEFDCIDEHMNHSLDDEEIEEFIPIKHITHKDMWYDLSEVNEDDIPW